MTSLEITIYNDHLIYSFDPTKYIFINYTLAFDKNDIHLYSQTILYEKIIKNIYTLTEKLNTYDIPFIFNYKLESDNILYSKLLNLILLNLQKKNIKTIEYDS